MNYSMMELVWLLLIYSFLGWVVETIVGTVKKKKFVNRGFSTGPFCLVYGIAAVFMAVTMEELMPLYKNFRGAEPQLDPMLKNRGMK